MNLQALKPTGALHQTWQGQFVAQWDDWLVVYTPLGTAVRHHTKDLTYMMGHSNLGIFSTKEYYNVFIDFHPDNTFKEIYINVAQPAKWDDHDVSWVDLELDVMVRAGQAPELLDEDEFEEARASGLISPELAEKTQAVADWLTRESPKGQFPFLMVTYKEALEKIHGYRSNA